MPVRLVIFDLDGTLWECTAGVCGQLLPPLALEGPDALRDATGAHLQLLPGARALLETLRGQGILLSAASLNDEPVAREALRLLGIEDLFSYPQLRWHPKDLSIRNILHLFAERAGIRLTPQEVLFVDDQADNIRMARDLGVRALQVGRDLKALPDLLEHLA
ncbi:MAG: magnesium-dependent phosphatase-1 [Planctomycetes bacterium]|nr:magnesium-dependent phosphatase-1 [Planctomycetota bacterium]